MTKMFEAILAIQAQKIKKQLKKFIGMINFYRNMWLKRSELLVLLNIITSAYVNFKWIQEHKETFQTWKR